LIRPYEGGKMAKKLTLCLIVILVGSSVLFSGSKIGKAEILWDTWGLIKHIPLTFFVPCVP
jgi:hypothetical protein